VQVERCGPRVGVEVKAGEAALLGPDNRPDPRNTRAGNRRYEPMIGTAVGSFGVFVVDTRIRATRASGCRQRVSGKHGVSSASPVES
jgi:hypothetical protein